MYGPPSRARNPFGHFFLVEMRLDRMYLETKFTTILGVRISTKKRNAQLSHVAHRLPFPSRVSAISRATIRSACSLG